MIVETGNLEKVYHPKNAANNRGTINLSAFLDLVFKFYFNKLVASSGNTNDGLKDFASSIDIKA